ncbi:hypothetical protein JHS3_13960 [Jeongeupia sp. HS-3]|uniref:SPOR domain-containing protein n=1 Tax=Jeongeupia sp. HS-3 TaxID=1009682 RepID=UPI0018A3DA80|nr:SPOR domain-containing protein [Jeongeupia sp. HS-3]BCL75660.1 hypothetical protein JHS3_13960 [Jeongeupia sp. HS-3]
MSDTPQRDANSAPDPIDEQRAQQKLRTQLYWRLGVAVALIGLVVGALQLLDHPKRSMLPPTPQIALPSPIASAPVTASASVAASTPDEAIISTPEASAVASVPAQQAIGNLPRKEPKPAAAPTETPQAKPTQTAPIAPAATLSLAAPAVAATKAPPKTPPAAPEPLAPASIVKRADGYSVQAGVFLHSENAEKLLRKLQAAGVPAYLETRVQIGPFKTRHEADAAAKKLRQLGINPVIAPALNQD